jgi:hypothetical protein
MTPQPLPTERVHPAIRLVSAIGLILLFGYTIAYLLSGIRASFSHETADLLTRLREYKVFIQGYYPNYQLVRPPVPDGLPYTVYPPYALPMFGLFFGFGSARQGWLVVHGLSMLSLALIGWIGWRTLRFAGPMAGLLGAIAPAAISGNSYSFFQGQFSILCMGLISLQWLLLRRRRPLAAGLCWAAAMLKPQIALAFALPLLWRRRRRGLLVGAALLLLLSGLALAHTGVGPLRVLQAWLNPQRMGYVKAGNFNLMAVFGGLSVYLLPLLFGLAVSCWFLYRWLDRRKLTAGLSHSQQTTSAAASSLAMQGLCSVIGCLAFYHHPYDNIMLYPALLAVFAEALRERRPWWTLLAVTMALSLWMPVHLMAVRPLAQQLSAGIWLMVGISLALQRPWRAAAASSDLACPATAP